MARSMFTSIRSYHTPETYKNQAPSSRIPSSPFPPTSTIAKPENSPPSPSITTMGKSAMNQPEVQLNRLSPRQIPAVHYTIQNIFMSMATVVSATASLFLTMFVILPLSVLRHLLPKDRLDMTPYSRNKVVLIVGASRGIGFNVLKQYAQEPDTVIIAAARSIDTLRQAIIELGDTPATIQCSVVDLMGNRKHIADSIKMLDKSYGPITHLYEVSGISNHLKDNQPWNLDVTDEMINVNVSGTVASVVTMYELMKGRGYGKICVVGSVAGIFNPANMITYAATKSFINTFATSLRVLAAPCGVDVVTVQPGFIDTRMTKQMRGQGSTIPGMEFASAEGMAKHMKEAVEGGGVGVVTWPTRQSVLMYALNGVNPICDELGKWVSMKMGMSGKKIT